MALIANSIKQAGAHHYFCACSIRNLEFLVDLGTLSLLAGAFLDFSMNLPVTAATGAGVILLANRALDK